MPAQRVIVLCVFALSILACTSSPADKAQHLTQEELQSQLVAQLQQAQLPAEALAYVAYPLTNPTEKVSYQAEKSMQPASTMKLLTSITGLELLGTAYRGKTQLLAYEQAQKQMRHPLVLQGVADMDLTLQQLWFLLQQAYDLGIRQIPAIHIDRSWFNPARQDLSALPFDETPREYYNLLPDALFLQRNMLGISLKSTAEQLSGQFYPSLQGLELITDQVQLTDTACSDWYPDLHQLAFKRQPHAVQLVVQGKFPKKCHNYEYLQLINRVDFTRLAIQQLWQQISGQIAVPVLEQKAAAATVLLAEHQSRSLAEVLRDINKNSDNALTRQLYLAIGAHQGATETELTAITSEKHIRSFIRKLALDDSSLSLENGSGLSRTERISPHLLAALLQHAFRAQYQPELLASLPLAGVDGSLKRRLTQAQTLGKARLKTGSLRNVVALAGFVTDQSGRVWVVASFINDPKAARARHVLDSLIEWITKQDDKKNLR